MGWDGTGTGTGEKPNRVSSELWIRIVMRMRLNTGHKTGWRHLPGEVFPLPAFPFPACFSWHATSPAMEETLHFA